MEQMTLVPVEGFPVLNEISPGQVFRVRMPVSANQAKDMFARVDINSGIRWEFKDPQTFPMCSIINLRTGTVYGMRADTPIIICYNALLLEDKKILHAR